MRKFMTFTILILSFVLITACGKHNDSDDRSNKIDDITDVNLDAELNSTLAKHAITGDPSTSRNLPNITDPIPQLGMKLFFTQALGGQKDTACVSCHHPKLGGGDNLSLSIGVSAETANLLGPGRKHSPLGANYDGQPPIPRNALTTFNIGMWDSFLFYDGRIESLSKIAKANGKGDLGIRTPDSQLGIADPLAGKNLVDTQALFPVTSVDEMKGFNFGIDSNESHRNFLAKRLQSTGNGNDALVTNNWLTEFQSAFGAGTAETLITFSNIAHAISEYQRSQVFINNPFKNYIDGDNAAISNDAKRGALFFFRTTAEDGANCASCHSGDFYTDEKFHIIAMPQIGRSKDNQNSLNANDDFGRFRETRLEQDMYKFRTPTLLNVVKTGPWGHTGAYTSIEATVRHHLNPQTAIDNYDFNQVDPSIDTSTTKVNTQFAIDKLKKLRVEGKTSPILKNVYLTDNQVNQLIAFLNSLTDSCIETEACIGKWIPSGDDPDALRINAIDNEGQAL